MDKELYFCIEEKELYLEQVLVDYRDIPIFSLQKEYWEIISVNEVAQDIVIKHSVNELNVDLLPKENAYYEVLTEEISAFVQKFNAEFWKAEHFSNIGLKGDLSEILINGEQMICLIV